MNEFLSLLSALNQSTWILVIVAIGVAMIFATWSALVWQINKRDAASEQLASMVPDGIAITRAAQLFLYFTVGLSSLIVFLVFAAFSQGTPEGRAFVTVAALILLGIAAFIGILSLLSRTAKRLGMIDTRHPFGLPEGSVRAILTIAFIVLVGVLSAFLITNHNSRSPFADEGLLVVAGLPTEAEARAEAAAQRQMFGSEVVVVIQPRTRTASSADGTPAPPVTVFDVLLHARTDNSMGDDIAKQTLTMISTILAAMIGFYFAERSGLTGGPGGGGAGADAGAVARRRALVMERLAQAKGRLAQVERALLRMIAIPAEPETEAGQKLVSQALAALNVRLPQETARLAQIEVQLASTTLPDTELDTALVSLIGLGGTTAEALMQPVPAPDPAADPVP